MRPHPQSKKRRNRDRARKWRVRRRHFYFYQPGALPKKWREPLLWRPLNMEELRYDKMGKGWQAAFEKWMKETWELFDRAIFEAVPLPSVSAKDAAASE